MTARRVSPSGHPRRMPPPRTVQRLAQAPRHAERFEVLVDLPERVVEHPLPPKGSAHSESAAVRSSMSTSASTRPLSRGRPGGAPLIRGSAGASRFGSTCPPAPRAPPRSLGLGQFKRWRFSSACRRPCPRVIRKSQVHGRTLHDSRVARSSTGARGGSWRAVRGPKGASARRAAKRGSASASACGALVAPTLQVPMAPPPPRRRGGRVGPARRHELTRGRVVGARGLVGRRRDSARVSESGRSRPWHARLVRDRRGSRHVTSRLEVGPRAPASISAACRARGRDAPRQRGATLGLCARRRNCEPEAPRRAARRWL